MAAILGCFTKIAMLTITMARTQVAVVAIIVVAAFFIVGQRDFLPTEIWPAVNDRLNVSITEVTEAHMKGATWIDLSVRAETESALTGSASIAILVFGLSAIVRGFFADILRDIIIAEHEFILLFSKPKISADAFVAIDRI